jgi:ribosomal protein S18 acetylase RimI-like enzyme
VIRASTPRDVPALYALIRELARYEKLEHAHVGTEERLREHLFGARPYCEALVADDDGPRGRGVVGFALFFHNYSTFLAQPGMYLEDLFVLPDDRRRGHGRDLLRAVARIAVERGCGRFEWSVLHWNEPAIRFYKALGATPLDEWGLFRLTGDALGNLAR